MYSYYNIAHGSSRFSVVTKIWAFLHLKLAFILMDITPGRIQFPCHGQIQLTIQCQQLCIALYN